MLRAKVAKEKASSNEVIDYTRKNESDLNALSDAEDHLDSVATSKSSTTTSLSGSSR